VHRKGKISHIEFLMTCSYLLSDIIVKELAEMYIVGYDTKNPHIGSKQYVHRAIILKCLLMAFEASEELDSMREK